MVVLGISGRDRDAAAAIVVDGRLAAAVSEESVSRVPRVGYRHSGGFPFSAATECLRLAGTHPADITTVAVARDTAPSAEDRESRWRLPDAVVRNGHAAWAEILGRRIVRRVHPLQADAAQVAAFCDIDQVLLVVVDGAGGATFLKRDGRLVLRENLEGAGAMADAARDIARTLGCEGDNPFTAFEQLAAFGQAEWPDVDKCLSWKTPSRIVIDRKRLSSVLGALVSTYGELDVPDSLNVHVQRLRQTIAATFQAQIETSLVSLLADLLERVGLPVAVGGSLFANGRLNTRLQQEFGSRISFTPVPEKSGRALGAAVAATNVLSDAGAPSIRLGPAFTEAEVKLALDGCRLDYVYEPDWNRLLARVSGLLSRGNVVAWFQGPMDFGPRSLGSRSALCDPSSRYARENINRFLKHRPVEHPLPLSVATADCMARPLYSPYMLLHATFAESCRDRLRGALDHRHSAPVQTVCAAQHPELHQLVELHQKRTGVPGLVNTTLSSGEDPTACTPRDAIRTTFSSAIDALIMERFLVMKDYWLLRSDLDHA